MHQPPMLCRHREKDLLEGIRIIVDKCQHTTETVDKMIQKATVNVRFYAVDEEG